jgi:AraC-like DNA-binding protein
MPRIGPTIFNDPADYQASLCGARVNFVFTGRGDFKARLTGVELPNLLLLCGQENLPRIAYLSLASKRVFVAFPMHFDPPLICGGIELRSGDVVFHSRGERMHQRTHGASRWAVISLTPELLARHGKVIAGLDLVPPPAARVLRPPAFAAAQLRRLHAEACRLAATRPDDIARGEVASALEQDLLRALINCLMAEEAPDHAATKRHHASIMVRFEEVLAAHSNRQLHMPELCAAVGVPERTLRICCAEILGMGPSQYARLRRLNMVRVALRRAEVAGTRIAQTAARYGFSEPGRFAVAYRSVFGETPSTTLRSARSSVRDVAPVEFA